jgi:translation elongation factor EF-Ts
VEGKLNKYYEQVCLVNQPFVKDPDVSVGKLTTDCGGEAGREYCDPPRMERRDGTGLA